MLDPKIIILLIGVFLITIGFVNHYKKDKSKYVYKVLPRNVYDEVFLSMPSLEYNDELYNKINMTYILDEYGDYSNLYEKPVKKCKGNLEEGCDIDTDFKPFISENERIIMEEEYFNSLSDRKKRTYIKNRELKNRRLTSNYSL